VALRELGDLMLHEIDLLGVLLARGLLQRGLELAEEEHEAFLADVLEHLGRLLLDVPRECLRAPVKEVEQALGVISEVVVQADDELFRGKVDQLWGRENLDELPVADIVDVLQWDPRGDVLCQLMVLEKQCHQEVLPRTGTLLFRGRGCDRLA